MHPEMTKIREEFWMRLFINIKVPAQKFIPQHPFSFQRAGVGVMNITGSILSPANVNVCALE